MCAFIHLSRRFQGNAGRNGTSRDRQKNRQKRRFSERHGQRQRLKEKHGQRQTRHKNILETDTD